MTLPFRPTKHHLREVLVHYFLLKKTAAESHRMMLEIYGKYALCEVTVNDWYARFEQGDFNVDKELPGYPKKYEDCIAEALLDKNPREVLSHMAKIVRPPNLAFSRRLTALHQARLNEFRRTQRTNTRNNGPGTSSSS